MPFKYSMIFSFTTAPAAGAGLPARTCSWTESHWRNAFDFTPTPNSAFFTKRCNLLPTAGRISAVRVTEYESVNSKLVQKSVRIFDVVVPGRANLECDIPQMGLQINFRASAPQVNVATTDIRAIPDARIVGGEYDNQAAYTNLVNDYCGALTEDAWGFMGIDMTAPKVRVISLANKVLTVGAGHGVVAGNWIKAYRVYLDGGKKLNGDFHVSAVAGNALTLDGVDADLSITKPNGLIRKVAPIFCDYGDFRIARARTHKVGRPFLPYRGRQRKAS